MPAEGTHATSGDSGFPHEEHTIRRALTAASLVTVVLPHAALAHSGHALDPHDLWHAWSVAPPLVAALFLAGCCYALGLRALWRRAGRGRGITLARAAACLAGMLALVIALVSPLDALGGALFSAHMVQHLLLVIVAAPLIVLGEPQLAALWIFPVATRRAIARRWIGPRWLAAAWSAVSHPAGAWMLHMGTLALWHVPRFYDTAIRDEGVHILEHAGFFLTALLFWWVVLDRHRMRVGGAAAYLFSAALAGTLLGALLTIAREPWYSAHLATTYAWGLSPLEDQQLAGLIMWVPAGFVYLIALLSRLATVLRNDGDAATPRRRVTQRAGVSARGTA